MEYHKYRLGDLIEQYDEINESKEFSDIDDLQGINSNKIFQECKSNKNDIDLFRYRICRKGMFSYNRATSRNGEKISIAYRTNKDCLVSPSYCCFSVKEKDILSSDYLDIWFKRPVFDRYARFNSWGSATEFFTYDDFCETQIVLPPIKVQQRIVYNYKVISDRIELLQKMMDKFTALVDAIYIKWIVLGESPYRSSEVKQTEMGYLPLGWKIAELGDYIESFSKSHSFAKNKLVFLNTSDILSGRFLKTAYMNVSDMPGQAKKSIAKGDILFSEIRPANKRFALVRCLADDYVVSTKLMVLRTTQNELSNLRVYHYLTMDKTLAELQKEAEGESGTFPQITFDGNLRHRKFIVADTQTETIFNKVLERHYAYIFNIQDEIDVLNSIKNMLLFEQNKGA